MAYNFTVGKTIRDGITHSISWVNDGSYGWASYKNEDGSYWERESRYSALYGFDLDELLILMEFGDGEWTPTCQMWTSQVQIVVWDENEVVFYRPDMDERDPFLKFHSIPRSVFDESVPMLREDKKKFLKENALIPSYSTANYAEDMTNK